MRPVDFNEKLREHGVDRRATVQKICRTCKDEWQIREVLDQLWNRSERAQDVLAETSKENDSVFEFEKAIIQ